MEKNNCKNKLLVLYGTVSGNSKKVAETIFSELEEFNFKERNIMEMDAYDKNKLIDEEIVIFVCSAIGNGREPFNMRNFWKFLLRQELPNDILSTLDIAVFGLGDSKYRCFNFPSKKLYKRLLELGANPIVNRGEYDARNKSSYSCTLNSWLKKLKDCMLGKGLVTQNNTNLNCQKYTIEVNTDAQVEKLENGFRNCQGKDILEVSFNKRVTPEDYFKEILYIELKNKDDNNNQIIKYNPGDILYITPVNLESEIDEVIKNLGWENVSDVPFVIKSNNPCVELNKEWRSFQTLRKLLVYSLDIFGIPDISFVNCLRNLINDELSEQEKIKFNHTEKILDQLINNKLSIYDVLLKYKCSAISNISIEKLLELLPIIEPRSYSIASSQTNDQTSIQLVVGVVKTTTSTNITRKGICTKWLRTLNSSDKILVQKEKGTMTLPSKENIPIILICTGTGVATMRTFIQERVATENKENYLFYGYRNTNCDDIFVDEFKNYSSKGYLNMFTAVSRDQEKKIYVQDRLEENSSLIWDLIYNRKAHIYVSGNIKTVPSSVKNALLNIFMKEGNLSKQDAKILINNLQINGVYQEECY